MRSSVNDECGVFGVWGDIDPVSMTYFGLLALQHRGQESAGITAASGSRLETVRKMGLVSEVFDQQNLDMLQQLQPTHTIGHTRYSTAGSSKQYNAQPLSVQTQHGPVALAHNGHFMNASQWRRRLESRGAIFQTEVDTEVIAHLVASEPGGAVDGIQRSLKHLRGGYALLIATKDRLLAVRDPLGIRPLVWGRVGSSVVLASETCALDAAGAEVEGDVPPGQIWSISEAGIETHPVPGANGARISGGDSSGGCSTGSDTAGSGATCVFEYVYLSRPDSDLNGRNVHQVRKQTGRLLAADFPVKADIVTGVPQSSLSAAAGYAEASGLPYEMALVKNRYAGRTFIQPEQAQRERSVSVKLNVIRRVVEGRRVVLVDDSIVRGTTMKRLIQRLREAGALEVHVRIASPPFRHPCFYGIDVPDRSRLIAAGVDEDEVSQRIGADSLHYLSWERLVEAVGFDALCSACFTGDYPMVLDEETEESEGKQAKPQGVRTGG